MICRLQRSVNGNFVSRRGNVAAVRAAKEQKATCAKLPTDVLMLATARLLCCSAALRACCAYLLCFPTCLQGAQVSARSVEEQTRATSTARSYLEKGKRAFAAQNLAEAQAQLELAVEADPKLDEAHFALGILELQRGEAAAAIPH